MAAIVAAGAGAACSAVAVPAASQRRSVHRRPPPPCSPALAASSAANYSRRRSASSSGSSSSSRSVQRWRCRGFVGEGSRVAGEYHSADFEWEELIEAGEAAVARQWQERRQHVQQQEGQQQLVAPRAAATGSSSGPASVSQGSASSSAACSSGGGASAEAGDGREEEEESWERFHAQHSQARFFKEKRYLMLEFPSLATTDPPQHIAEIGCGCGSALLPVLKANPTCRVTGCDISPTALRLLGRAAEQAGVAANRIRTFVLDAASPGGSGSSSSGGDGLNGGGSSSSGDGLNGGGSSSSGDGLNGGGGSSSLCGSPLAGLEADSCLLVFTLSALAPEDQPALLAHAYAALRPGGLLLFRDYGLYDMAQLRFPGAQLLGDCLYRRSEGTLAYFFSTQAIASLAQAAGFETVECEYARVQLRNRKHGSAMRRVFVHGVFRKTLDAPPCAASPAA